MLKSFIAWELYLNKLVGKASKVIVIGSVEPHYFAGYTGGRKAFLPGVAAFRSIEQNHRMALSPEARALALEGNPVHDDLMEAMELVRSPVYSIMTVLDRNHEIDTVTAGDITKSFEDAVVAANRIFTAPLEEKADIVVTAAPYPMDVDLYQSQKAIDNAKLALKDGGTMILVSACREGIGGEAFARLLSSASTPDEVLRKIDEGFKLGYHKAAKMAEVFGRAEVMAYSTIDDDQLRSIFITPVHDLQNALDAGRLYDSSDAAASSLAAQSAASLTCPILTLAVWWVLARSVIPSSVPLSRSTMNASRRTGSNCVPRHFVSSERISSVERPFL